MGGVRKKSRKDDYVAASKLFLNFSKNDLVLDKKTPTTSIEIEIACTKLLVIARRRN